MRIELPTTKMVKAMGRGEGIRSSIFNMLIFRCPMWRCLVGGHINVNLEFRGKSVVRNPGLVLEDSIK